MAEQFGADSLRLYGLFVAPFEETVQWTTKGIEGAYRFVNRLWRLWTELRPHYSPNWREQATATGDIERKLRRKLHQTLRKVGDDIENFRFNTCVAALMEFVNEFSAFRNALGSQTPTSEQAALISEILETVALMIAPLAPHLADEFWERLGKEGFTFRAAWLAYDPAAAAEETITIVVQINGKLRERLQVAPDTSAAEIERLALACEKVQSGLADKTVRKIITLPGKLVNIVV
jgi:leucyl-tRNA synthetase